jgi:hypothetical protein
VVTVSATCPAAAGGLVAVISVEESTTKLDAAADPKSTAVAPERFDPFTVTVVPPAVVPSLGLRPLTVGDEGGD